MRSTDGARPSLGFIGLGAMGGPMARNLLSAGRPLIGFDVKPDRVAECTAAGARAAQSAAEVVARSDFVLTSLRSSEVFVEVAEAELVPNVRQGQVFIDLGTTTPPETRRLASAFAEKGADLLDAPVSGGPAGAERGTLHMFVGGKRASADRARPILEVLGEPSRITYCGGSGMGQVVKGVNQLVMGLGLAAHLEAMAFGVRAGVDADVIASALQGSESWRQCFTAVAKEVVAGQGDRLDVKFAEYHYFLREAKGKDFELPLTQALFDFMSQAERIVGDSMNRPTPALWYELATPPSGSRPPRCRGE